MASPIPADAPVMSAVACGEGSGSATLAGYPLRALSNIRWMEGSEGFNIFGDPDELRERLGELANQMQDTQRVAGADNAIKLAVDMTVAAINRLDLSGGSDEQAVQVRDAIRIVFPEAVTLVREAREGLA